MGTQLKIAMGNSNVTLKITILSKQTLICTRKQ